MKEEYQFQNNVFFFLLYNVSRADLTTDVNDFYENKWGAGCIYMNLRGV
jgi:hypothetical protein